MAKWMLLWQKTLGLDGLKARLLLPELHEWEAAGTVVVDFSNKKHHTSGAATGETSVLNAYYAFFGILVFERGETPKEKKNMKQTL